MKTITIGILFIGCLAINFLLRKVLASIKGSSGVLAIIKKYFPLLELTFWGAFLFWVSTMVGLQYKSYFQFLLLIMSFVLFFWFFIRDYIAGIQLKSRYNFSPGQSYKSGQVSGLIKKIRLLYIEIKSDSGGEYKIPYSQIDQKSLELNIQEKGAGESLIKVELDASLNEISTSQRIIELVINTPWCSHKSTPIVNVLEETNGQKTYEISCVLLGENGGKLIREMIENEFGQKKTYLRKQS